MGALLQRAGFALPVVDSETVTVTYADPLALMQEIKAMGASNMLIARRRTPVTRGLLLRAAEIYAERFAGADGRVPATFEILTLTAWAPDASQPQAAASRLGHDATCRCARCQRAQAEGVAVSQAGRAAARSAARRPAAWRSP